MTPQEAADQLGIDRSRVLKFLNAGRLKGTKHGRQWWIEQADLNAFAALDRKPGWEAGKPRKTV